MTLLFVPQAFGSQIAAHCSLYAHGRSIWKGKCCIDERPLDKETSSLSAESWKGCLYDRKHPRNSSQPMPRCYAPWLAIYANVEGKKNPIGVTGLTQTFLATANTILKPRDMETFIREKDSNFHGIRFSVGNY
jgi:hypothetical protein